MNQPPSEASLGTSLARRRFLAGSVAMATIPWNLPLVHSASVATESAESWVGELFGTLSSEQQRELCLPFDHPSRLRVNANWHVTQPLIGSDYFSASQKSVIEKIVKAATSEEGYERLQQQMMDDSGGLGGYSMALFGTPKDPAFEWMLTGRHLTLRIDGNSIPKTAFGGVLVYGHGEESKASDNLFYYQTEKANAFFKSFNAEQAKAALHPQAPGETDLRIRQPDDKSAGLNVGMLSTDQQELFKSCLHTILSPYRQEDGQEALQLIEEAGGIAKLRMAFFQESDLEKDGVWDMWRIEGPGCVIHFRGAPHVHAYIHIANA